MARPTPPANSPAPSPRRPRWLGALLVLATGAVALVLVFRAITHRAPTSPALPATPASSVSNKNLPSPDAASSGQTPPAAPTASSALDERWRQWLARLANAGDDAQLAADFEQLVAADPAAALARARLEADPARRNSLVLTILLLWAESDANAAAAAARTLPDFERAAGIAAVFAGAVRDPEAAVRLAVAICRDDPSLAFEHGNSLIAALSRTGEFRTAVRFALGDAGNPADEDRNKWLKTVFFEWAAQNPAASLAALQELPSTGPRFEALDAIAASRVRTDPAGVAETLRILPPGVDRNLALSQTLRMWVARDPKTAADWLDRLPPSPELDAGAAELATQPRILAQRPAVALSWAESIVDAGLRSRTVATVVESWAATQRDAALHHARTSPDLLPADRAALLTRLTAQPTP